MSSEYEQQAAGDAESAGPWPPTMDEVRAARHAESAAGRARQQTEMAYLDAADRRLARLLENEAAWDVVQSGPQFDGPEAGG